MDDDTRKAIEADVLRAVERVRDVPDSQWYDRINGLWRNSLWSLLTLIDERQDAAIIRMIDRERAELIAEKVGCSFEDFKYEVYIRMRHPSRRPPPPGSRPRSIRPSPPRSDSEPPPAA